MPKIAQNKAVNKSRRASLKVMELMPIASYGLTSLFQDVKAGSSSTCVLAPALTEGPHWVDEKLNRSDVTTGTTHASVLNALPLTLAINVYNASVNSCGTIQYLCGRPSWEHLVL